MAQENGNAVSLNASVRVRIEERVKNEVAALATMGLTVSDAFRLLLTRIAVEEALPFDPVVPNKGAIAAERAARRHKR